MTGGGSGKGAGTTVCKTGGTGKGKGHGGGGGGEIDLIQRAIKIQHTESSRLIILLFFKRFQLLLQD